MDEPNKEMINAAVETCMKKMVERLSERYGFACAEALAYLGSNSDSDSDAAAIPQPKKILNEDLGQIFEMAICKFSEIEFDGKYNYSDKAASDLAARFPPNLKEMLGLQMPMKHTARGGSRYDFESCVEGGGKLSAKTNKKKNGKVCPQVIGQPTKKKFCEFFGLEYVVPPPIQEAQDQSQLVDIAPPTDELITLEESIKIYIEKNIKTMLPQYFEATMDCPILYYVDQTKELRLIKEKSKIDWSAQDLSFLHATKKKKWNESTTLKIGETSIGEFQVHTKRDCIKYRWHIENLLKLFPHNFDIIKLVP